MIFIRSLLFNIFFFGTTTVFVLFTILLQVFPSSVMRWFVSGWARAMLLYLRIFAGISYEIRGMENAPAGPKIYVCKHQSAWETIIFLIINRDVAFVLKKELTQIPVYGWAAKKAEQIAVDRAAGASALRGMTKGAQEAISRGRDVIIFPEGTRTPVGETGKYHPGVMALYNGVEAPIVPVAVNSGLFWGRNAFSKKPGKVILDIMPPIEPGLARKEFMTRLTDTIEARTRLLEEEGQQKHSLE